MSVACRSGRSHIRHRCTRLMHAGLALAAATLAVIAPAPIVAPRAQPAEEIDLALVLAVDISFSMDDDEQRLQRLGYVEALRSEDVLGAIRLGLLGRIAVIYVEWAGARAQQVVVPWQVISDRASADAFVSRLAEAPVRRDYRTSISGGIDFSVQQFDQLPARAMRRVIDMSGDGPNNQGRSVTAARDEAVARGITINGLPLMLKEPGYLGIDHLDIYYEDCVIGGAGAFVVPVRDGSQLVEGIRKKLLMEIAAPTAASAPIRPASASAPRVSCSIGERDWQDKLGN